MIFRSGNRNVKAESCPTIYHQSKSVKVRLDEQDLNPPPPPPKLLFVLDEALNFDVNEGDTLSFDETEFGSMLSNENGNAAFIHGVEATNQQYEVVGEIPEYAPLYVYVDGNTLSFHTEALEAAEAPYRVFQWMGKGIYYLHRDGIWRHERCNLTHIFTDSYYANQMIMGAMVADEIVDVEKEIATNLHAVGLSVSDHYSGLSVDQCDFLAQIADWYKISWCWSEREIKRPFRKAVKYCSFTWNYGGEE